MKSMTRFAALAVVLASFASFGANAQEAPPPIPLEKLKLAPKPKGLVVLPVLNASKTVVGQPVEYTKTDNPEVVSVMQLFDVGGETGWHYHVHSSHIFILEGELELETLDGAKYQFKQGQAYMESVNVWHNGRNVGKGPLKILAVSFIEKGKSNNVFPKFE